jgi:Rod binding domain-containing protein
MEVSKLLLTGAVSSPSPLEDAGKIEGASDERKKQIAKDFESVLLTKVLDEMKNTIGNWGSEEDQDGASEQVKGLFWMYLGNNISNNGGVGLWKDIYKSFNESADAGTKAQPLDKSI